MLQIATTICSYLSPTILFLLLNVVIATILLTSKPQNPTSTNPPLARAPSLVLDRLKSFNFKSFTLHAPEPETHSIAVKEHVIEEHHIDRCKADAKPTAGEFPREKSSTNSPLARAPSLVLDRIKSFNFKSFTLHAPEPETHSIAVEEHVIEEHHIDRCKSDAKPTAGEFPDKLPKKMKKSATMKSAFDHFKTDEAAEKEREDNAVRRRPATMKEKARADDVEVDAKCDDFINRFKQQLKLQRMDSILRYKEMLKRGN